jgi:hypothetical protein
MTDLFVSRTCTAYPPQGPAFLVEIGVFPPVATEQRGWQCKLSLDGVLDEERLAFGVDQWQALQMGMQMVWLEITFKAAMGWRFGWFNGESMDLAELLPHWGRQVAPTFP